MPPVDADSATSSTRPKASDELRTIALLQFASTGFSGTSLQQIADEAGYSKSSVLYHYANKEALLEAAIGPAIDRLGALLARFTERGPSLEARGLFVEDFIDFLLDHRLEVYTFINQGSSLRGIPVIDRANAFILELSNTVCDENASTEDKMRFGVALGGAAYSLVAGMAFLDGEQLGPVDEVRAALIKLVGELLAPVSLPSV
ncbi:MAG: TetR/AcrR family transcriptional regulator [Microterricola sp.]